MADADRVPLERSLASFLLERFPEALIILDRAGTVVHTNRTAREPRYRALLELFEDSAQHARLRAFLARLAESRRGVIELRLSGSRESAQHVLLTGEAVDDWLMVVARDQGEKRALQLDLEQLRQVESLGLATARIVHDLNNLLGPILSATRELQRTVERNSEATLLASEVESATLRAIALIREVSSFARRRGPSLEIMNLNSVISSMLPLIQRLLGGGISLVLRLEEQLGLGRVERTRFEQTLLNLVANAAHAMPRGGQLTIETLNLRLAPGRDHDGCTSFVALVVSDTGAGMSEETRRRALDDFFTTRADRGGTGLGLSSARRFALENGGMIHVESELGRGTSVTIRLPRVDRCCAQPTQLPPLE